MFFVQGLSNLSMFFFSLLLVAINLTTYIVHAVVKKISIASNIRVSSITVFHLQFYTLARPRPITLENVNFCFVQSYNMITMTYEFYKHNELHLCVYITFSWNLCNFLEVYRMFQCYSTIWCHSNKSIRVVSLWAHSVENDAWCHRLIA